MKSTVRLTSCVGLNTLKCWCAVPFCILADRQTSSRKTSEIPPVRGTSASLYQFKDQCKLEAESPQSMKSMKIPL